MCQGPQMRYPELSEIWRARQAWIGCGLARLQPNVFQWRRPRIRIDQHQGRLRDPRPDAARPDELPERSESHALVEQLLDLVQGGLALAPVGLARLLTVERVDVGIGAARVGAVRRHRLGQAGGGVA